MKETLLSAAWLIAFFFCMLGWYSSMFKAFNARIEEVYSVVTNEKRSNSEVDYIMRAFLLIMARFTIIMAGAGWICWTAYFIIWTKKNLHNYFLSNTFAIIICACVAILIIYTLSIFIYNFIMKMLAIINCWDARFSLHDDREAYFRETIIIHTCLSCIALLLVMWVFLDLLMMIFLLVL